MCTATKHQKRSKKSYNQTKATLGNIVAVNHRKNPSKAIGGKTLTERIAEAFGFRKQAR